MYLRTPRARKRPPVLADVSYIGISFVPRVSPERQITEVVNSKPDDEQRDQEASAGGASREFQSPDQLGQRIRFNLHRLTGRAFHG